MQEKDEAIKKFLVEFLGTHQESFMGLLDRVSSVISFPRRSVLFLEGQLGSCIYYVLNGSIRLFRMREDGSEFVIHFVKENEVFAELLPFLGGRYPVSAQALEPTRVLAIHADTFEALLSKDPSLGFKIIAALTARIQGFLRAMETLANPDVSHRLMAYLKDLATRRGSLRIRLPAPKRDIALLLGTTPETLSRLLKKLEDEGKLKVRAREIELTEGSPL